MLFAQIKKHGVGVRSLIVGFVLLILQCSVQCFVDHCLFLMGFVLLILQCSVECFVDHCLFLVGSYCSFFSVLCSVL
jgi:hypothetical protein